MATDKISEKVKSFIFEYIDSVEQLEVLLFLRQHRDREFDAEQISKELRSNLTSVNGRLTNLKTNGLISEGSNSFFRYPKEASEAEEIISMLAEDYKIRRHSVLQVIFSPLKKMKKFADSFVFNGQDKKNGDGDG